MWQVKKPNSFIILLVVINNKKSNEPINCPCLFLKREMHFVSPQSFEERIHKLLIEMALIFLVFSLTTWTQLKVFNCIHNFVHISFQVFYFVIDSCNAVECTFLVKGFTIHKTPENQHKTTWHWQCLWSHRHYTSYVLHRLYDIHFSFGFIWTKKNIVLLLCFYVFRMKDNDFSFLF